MPLLAAASSDGGSGDENDGGVTVRVDTGVRQGDTVTVHYDPMIAKLIVHAATRGLAIRAMDAALQLYQVAGLPTNIGFVRRLLNHRA
eukprot:SAG11_NODE_3897_length_2159_cov_1.950000_4_plen_87_part_01